MYCGILINMPDSLCYRSGQKWAHVSCALWIPEVSIGDAEKMEPVTKIKDIKVCCVISCLSLLPVDFILLRSSVLEYSLM